MCHRSHPGGDCLCDAARLEVFYPEPDAVRPNGSREELTELAKGFRISNWHCVNGCDEPAVEGGCCVSCASWRFGEVS